MKVIYDLPAAKFRKELRGNIPKEAKLLVTIETVKEVTASLEAGFKRMTAAREIQQKREEQVSQALE